MPLKLGQGTITPAPSWKVVQLSVGEIMETVSSGTGPRPTLMSRYRSPESRTPLLWTEDILTPAPCLIPGRSCAGEKETGANSVTGAGLTAMFQYLFWGLLTPLN